MKRIAASFLGAASLFTVEAHAQPYPPSPYLFLNEPHTWGAPQTFTQSAAVTNGFSVDSLAVSGINISDTFSWVGGINNLVGGSINYQAGGINGFVRVNGGITSGLNLTFFNELFFQDALNTVGGAGVLTLTDQAVGGYSGGRIALTTNVYATTTPAVTGDYTFVSDAFYAVGSASMGGTSGAPAGDLFSVNPSVQLTSGATYWNGIVGGEVDIAVNPGASVKTLIGWHIGLLPNHAVRGSVDDVGLLFAGAGQAVGLTVGIGFGTTSKPTAFDSLSTFVKAFPGTGTSGLTVMNGIDFSSGITFTGNSYMDGHFALTGSGEFVQSKITDPNVAPGSGKFKMTVEAGTNAGTCKIVARAGTSATPVTIVDNVGSGC